MRRLVLVAILLAAVVVMLGAYTRLTDAGLGCPDWPGCYGQLTVPQTEQQVSQANMAYPERPVEPHKAWNEMIHRYFAGALGLLVLFIFLASFMKRAPHRPWRHPFMLLVVVVFQAALGMWTVTMNLMPVVVMGHLLGGFTVISLLFLLYLRLKQIRIPGGDKHAKSLLKWLYLALAIVVAQIALGGWTAANYAAVTCTTLPVCETDWLSRLDIVSAFTLPDNHTNYEFGVMNYDARMTIHVLHRIGAVITVGYLLWLMFKIQRKSVSSIIRRLGLVMGGIVLLQFGLGISNVVFKLPISVAVAHNFVAACLLMSVVSLIYMVSRKA
ncbi:COX15/CtaA family protein [Flocculibacter collagenilyticus]|uniref:COX15/CtaA family protein n=1 Tax=Flocculibacter collagenilyticus TaxID=2744479 RepID=UPI0018F41DF7|nr:COX15/CtaA family protein [Flocculibacter collagenilyticus]